MATTDVSPVSGASYFGTVAAKSKGDLDMATFLNLLVTQLQNQNPLEPMDDSAFYGQIAQLGQVQGLEKLNSGSDLQQAQSLLGKTVTATRPTSSASGAQGETFTGTVTKIVFKNGTQYINVQEDNGGQVQIQLDAIQSVLPTADVASAAYLIGHTIAGTANDSNATSVVGVVAGISAENGQAIAQVYKDGTYYSVPVSTITQVVYSGSSSGSSSSGSDSGSSSGGDSSGS